MSNRVEELESKVAELQAAVNGLTEELVETKERVRLLEDQVEVDLTTGTRPVGHAPAQPEEPETESESTPTPEPESSEADAAADGGNVDENEPSLRESPAQAQSRAETSAQPSDDASFIDADAPKDSPAAPDDPSDDAAEAEPTDPADDEVKSEESETTDEAESAEDDSDIIVA
ncbi:hypothetical protein C474_17384 [Halogeometricum pallidum JCM 14848]|uniref:BZIP transcription factor n=1 Tax=Halogeometricum pallidum JCM 14848 TaxID=1227487 RepID=M0CWY6_HALPD|nr:hypothetical protein [Halogeometricum pallidum]ELZ27143.1 hypothetical protein C474_17384 [Halogeometricum pallidum JCM 14848]